MKPFFVTLAVCSAAFVFAQAEPGSYAPIDETTAEIDVEEDATTKIQAFLDEKGWTEGDNAKADGSVFIVSVGYGTIAAPPSHPSYNVSRSRAFAKAMLDAKAQMATFLEQDIAVAMERTYTEQGAGGAKTPQEQMADALNSMPDDSLIGKGKRYLHKKLDNLLAAEGEDLSEQRAKAQADYDAAAAKAKQLASTETFKRAIGATATSYIAGLQAFYTVEAQGKGENGEIGVVAIWSPALAETAAMLTDGKIPNAVRKGKKPIREQIPTDTDVLLTTFGVQQKIDENGQLVLVSYAQNAARSSSKTAQREAHRKAQLEADAQIRSFAGEAVTTNAAMEEAETSMDYNLEGQLPDYSDESSYSRYQASVAKALTINGIKTIKPWTAVHPVSGQKVYGVIRAWSPSGAAFARELKASIEASAKGAAEGRRTIGASATKAAPVSATKVNKEAENKSRISSGDAGDEDAF